MKLTGGQFIIKHLEKEGVPYVLGIPGHGVLALFDALRQSDKDGKVRYIQVKHEQAAVHMADGYFRMTGRPLATLSSIGPGSLNTVIGLATSYVDSSAVLSLCGDTHTNMKGVGVLQEIERYQDSNFIRVLEPVVKRAWRAETAGQLPRIMQRAFSQMCYGRPGPVAVALPMDVQADEIDIELPALPPAAPEEARLPSDEAVEKAAALMREAKRPVILLGGAALRMRAADKLVSLAEKWGAAVVTTLAGKSAFPENHPLYGFHAGSKGTPVGLELCRSADVILALGTRFADETTCSYRHGVSFSFPETKLIHVDISAEEIGKNYRADVGIVADLVSTAERLTAAFGPSAVRKEYFAEILDLKRRWSETLAAKRAVDTPNCTISQLIGIMNEILPEDTIISSSSGNTQAQLFQEYCFGTPYTCLTTGGFSTMGWAVPAAAGAKLACPDRPVVALVGDGDFMMTMQEMSTLVQYNIPMITIVANNMGWFAIKDLQRDAYGEEYMFGNDWMKGDNVYSPDFAAAAAAFGLYSEKVSTKADAADAIKRALAHNGPSLIEVEVCRDYPNTGGDAFGWWDVPVPGYIGDRRKGFEAGKNEEQWTF